MRNGLGITFQVLRWAGLVLGALIVLVFLVIMIGEGSHPPLMTLSVESLLTWCLLVWCVGVFAAVMWPATGALLGLFGVGAFYAFNLFWSGRFPNGPVFPLMWIPPFASTIFWVYGKRTGGVKKTEAP